jgi:hypothetical protein
MLTLRPHKCQGCSRYFCSPCSPHELGRDAVGKLFPAAAAAAVAAVADAPAAAAAGAAGGAGGAAADKDKGASLGKEKKALEKERLCSRCFVQAMEELYPDAESSGGAGGPGGALQKSPYQLMEEDVDFEKYFRMLKMGVMREAVALKMMENDVPAAAIEIFKGAGQDASAGGAHGSSSGKGKGGSSGGKDGHSGSSSGSGKKGKGALRQVQWTALDDAAAARSVFGQLTGVGAGSVKARLTVEEELRLLELFGTGEQLAAAAAASAGKKSGGGSGGGDSPPRRPEHLKSGPPEASFQQNIRSFSRCVLHVLPT